MSSQFKKLDADYNTYHSMSQFKPLDFSDDDEDYLPDGYNSPTKNNESIISDLKTQLNEFNNQINKLKIQINERDNQIKQLKSNLNQHLPILNYNAEVLNCKIRTIKSCLHKFTEEHPTGKLSASKFKFIVDTATKGKINHSKVSEIMNIHLGISSKRDNNKGRTVHYPGLKFKDFVDDIPDKHKEMQIYFHVNNSKQQLYLTAINDAKTPSYSGVASPPPILQK